MMKTVAFQARTHEVTGTRRMGQVLAPLVGPGDVVLLSGDLGAGKTVLAKGLAEGLGVVEPITSPTFNILLVHQGRIPLHHFDLYRLDAAEQLEDVDYFGTLEAGGVSLVEWGDRFGEADPEERVAVRITIEGDKERVLAVEGRGRRGAQLAEEWRGAVDTLDGVEVMPG